MWGIVSRWVLGIFGAVVGLLLFLAGGKLNQGKRDKKELDAIKDGLGNAKEADREANNAKNDVTTGNVVDKLNGL
jgi:hypothetical protein